MAYALASNKTYPSWGYMTEHGATTIWELMERQYGKSPDEFSKSCDAAG